MSRSAIFKIPYVMCFLFQHTALTIMQDDIPGLAHFCEHMITKVLLPRTFMWLYLTRSRALNLFQKRMDISP